MNQPSAETKAQLWTFSFAKIMLIGFIQTLCNTMAVFTLPVYAQQIGASPTAAGLTLSIFAISTLLFRPLAGTILDRRGRKAVLLAGMAIIFAATLSYYFVYSVGFLLLFRLVHGIGFSASSTSIGTIVSDVVPKARLMEGIGYYSVATATAMATGPAVGLFVGSIIGMGEVYLIVAGLTAFGFIAALRIDAEKYSSSAFANASEKRYSLIEKAVLKPSFVMLFVAAAQSAVISFLALYALSIGVDHIEVFFTLYAVVMILCRPVIGKLSDRRGAFGIMLLLLGLSVLTLAIIPLASSLAEFILISLFYGVSFGSVFPLLNGIAMKLCPPNSRGAGNATFLSSMDAGYGIGSVIWGAVAQYSGYTAMFAGAAGSVAVAMLLFILFFRKMRI